MIAATVAALQADQVNLAAELKRAAAKEIEIQKLYEEKLKQANNTIEKLKLKEEQETIEMERSLKLIEKKLSEMQKRAESAEIEKNEKLRKQVKKPNQNQPNSEAQLIHEKTHYVVTQMNKMALEGEQSLRVLLNLSKDFGTLMDMLSTLDKISTVDEK